MKNKVKKILEENGIEFDEERYNIANCIYYNETKCYIGLTDDFAAIWIANRMPSVKVIVH